MKIIQAFNQEQRLIDEFGEVNNEHLRYYTKSLKVDSLLLRPAMALFKVLAYGVIVMYFGLSFESAGFTAGIIYAFIQYTNQLFNPLIELMQNFSILQTSIISAGRVFTLIDNEEYEPEQKRVTIKFHVVISNSKMLASLTMVNVMFLKIFRLVLKMERV